MSPGRCILRTIRPHPRIPVSRFKGMPLRAKVTDPSFRSMASIASQTGLPSETGPFENDPDDVLFHANYGVRTIELNRPKKLNSLNWSMATKIMPRLKEWEKSDMANVIIMKGAGEKALCAGGDVATLAQWNEQGAEGQQKSKDYFAVEYKLDHLIATYSKPYVAFMDGITMGGGVGLSVHAPFRIATERTKMAMPETGIGFFPEVGGSFFLPRLDGKLGTYMALTGEMLVGVNAFYNGVATHYLHSSALPDLENRLAELTFKDYATLQERFAIIDSTIEEFVTGLPHDVPMALAGEIREAIDECFAADDVSEIMSRLDGYQNDPKVGEWAKKTLQTLGERSPTSLKVTLKQMQLGKSWSIADAFDREYNIASVFMGKQEFIEGVSAKLIKKTKGRPNWQPSTLDEVSWEEVDNFFANPEGQERLQLLNTGIGSAYMKYPHGWIGLPNEEDVRTFVKENSHKSKKEVLDHFVQLKQGKLGVSEKVSEMLDRKVEVQENELKWKEPPQYRTSRGSQDPSRPR